MSFPTFFQKLFQNAGTGDKLRKDIMPFPQYELCEFYYFRHPTLKPGFAPCNGSLIEHADELYPEAWAYLQTAEGAHLVKSQADWTAMSNARFWGDSDNANVKKASDYSKTWGGVGGVPYYAINLTNKTIRLPDTRGMYVEASGGGLGVGAVHGPGLPNVVAKLYDNDNNENQWSAEQNRTETGAMRLSQVRDRSGHTSGKETGLNQLDFNAGWSHRAYGNGGTQIVRVKAYGMLSCVYLGIKQEVQ